MANGRPDIIKAFNNLQSYINEVHSDTNLYNTKLVNVIDSFKKVTNTFSNYDKFIGNPTNMNVEKMAEYQSGMMMAYLDLYCEIEEYKEQVGKNPKADLSQHVGNLDIIQEAIYNDLRTFQFFMPEPGVKFENSFRKAEQNLAANPMKIGALNNQIDNLISERTQSRKRERIQEQQNYVNNNQQQNYVNNNQQQNYNNVNNNYNQQANYVNNNQRQNYVNNNQQPNYNNFNNNGQNIINNQLNQINNQAKNQQLQRKSGYSFMQERALKRNVKLLQFWTTANLMEILYNKVKDDPTANPAGLKNVENEFGKFAKMIYPFHPKRSENPLIPTKNDLDRITAQAENVNKIMQDWTSDYIKKSANPDEQIVSIAADIMKKINDDRHVVKHTKAGIETLSASAAHNSNLKDNYGLTFDKTHAFPCKPGTYQAMMDKIRGVNPVAAGNVQVSNVQQAPRAVQESVEQNNASDVKAKIHYSDKTFSFSPQGVRNMFEEITQVSRELEAADPKWMWTASGQYGTMKNSIKELKNYVQNENHLLVNGANDKEFDRILWNAVTSIKNYALKKERDFQQDGNRREDPGKQKWEQRRIRAAMHAFQKVSKMTILSEVNLKNTDGLLEIGNRKDSLLSSESKKIFDAENKPAKRSNPVL